MSGFLGDSVNNSSINDVLDTLFTKASFRNIEFYVPNSDAQDGRRIIQQFFPGTDNYVIQDMGAQNGPIRVSGFLSGGTTLATIERLRRAFLTKGPGTLLHPWLGIIECYVQGQPNFSFAENQLGTARFDAVFIRAPQNNNDNDGLFSDLTDTFSTLNDVVDNATDQVFITARSLLSPLILPMGLLGAVTGVMGDATGIWNSVTQTAPVTADGIQEAVRTPLATLSNGVSFPQNNTTSTYADQVVAALGGVPAALANAVSGETPAIGPAAQVAGTNEPTGIPAQTAVDLLLNGADRMASTTPGNTLIDQGSYTTLMALSQGLTLAQAASASTTMEFISQEDVLAFRARLLAAFDAFLEKLHDIDGVTTDGLSAAIEGMRAALYADLTSQIGRLPAVKHITLPAAVPAWTVAWNEGADNPSLVEQIWQDLIARNNLQGPDYFCEPGIVDVLDLTP